MFWKYRLSVRSTVIIVSRRLRRARACVIAVPERWNYNNYCLFIIPRRIIDCARPRIQRAPRIIPHVSETTVKNYNMTSSVALYSVVVKCYGNARYFAIISRRCVRSARDFGRKNFSPQLSARCIHDVTSSCARVWLFFRSVRLVVRIRSHDYILCITITLYNNVVLKNSVVCLQYDKFEIPIENTEKYVMILLLLFSTSGRFGRSSFFYFPNPPPHFYSSRYPFKSLKNDRTNIYLFIFFYDAYGESHTI